MKETIEMILNYGGTLVLATLFVYMFLTDRKELKEEKKNNTQILKELSASNNNIAESLNLLKTSIEINTDEYKQHDERAIKGFNTMEMRLIKIEEKLNK